MNLVALCSTFDTSNSPLPQAAIHDLYADAIGRLWIGIWAEGLFCYDGQNWAHWNKSNSGLPSNYVHAVTGDGFGNIWLGFCFDNQNQSLASFDGLNFTVHHPFPDSFDCPAQQGLVADIDGNLYAGTLCAGLWRYDGLNWDDITPQAFKDTTQTLCSAAHKPLVIDKWNRIWYMTEWYGIWVSDTLEVTGVDQAVQPEIRVYPNPAFHTLQIDLPGDIDFSECKITVRNALGWIAMVRELDGFRNVSLDLHSLPAGVYYIILQEQQGTYHAGSFVKL